MEVIEIHNGNDVVATSIHLSEEERQNVEKTIGIMKGFEAIAKDPRDVFEFKYAQKLLKMVLCLDTVEDLTKGIDAILLDPDLIADIDMLAPEMEEDEITAIAEMAQAVAELWDKFILSAGSTISQPPQKDTPSKKKERKKSCSKIEDKYEQLPIDFPEDYPEREG